MIALIPARGGSKGLPGKNIKPLLGKPLLAYTIEAALNSEYIERVVVSTDDKRIAEIAVEYGAEVPFLRPEELATDSALAIDTYNYMIERLEKEQNANITDFMVLLPTVPFRTSIDIDKAYDLYCSKQADSVISFTPEQHPVSWHKYVDPEGKFEDVFPDFKLSNRQDTKKTYYPNGAIYVFKKSLLQKGKYYNDNSYAYIMPRERSIDIDTLEDFEFAEFLIKKKNVL